MDLDRIVRVSKDGILFEPHEFALKEYMRWKPLPSMDTEPARQYCTNVCQAEKRLDEDTRRTQHAVEANLGIGGGGKTHRNLVDKGLQRVLYIAPSWKLARNKQAEFGCRTTVVARAMHDDPTSWSEIDTYANVLVWDEVSMMWSETGGGSSTPEIFWRPHGQKSISRDLP